MIGRSQKLRETKAAHTLLLQLDTRAAPAAVAQVSPTPTPTPPAPATPAAPAGYKYVNKQQSCQSEMSPTAARWQLAVSFENLPES